MQRRRLCKDKGCVGGLVGIGRAGAVGAKAKPTIIGGSADRDQAARCAACTKHQAPAAGRVVALATCGEWKDEVRLDLVNAGAKGAGTGSQQKAARDLGRA